LLDDDYGTAMNTRIVFNTEASPSALCVAKMSSDADEP
jgi:hypothetical protein